MQATRGLVRLAAELSPRMQRGEDHFQSAELLELGVRIDRDATAVIPHRQPIALLQCDLDEAGMAGHRLVHGVVERFGRQVVQGGFVGAADIHAGTAAHRLQALQDLGPHVRELFARVANRPAIRRLQRASRGSVGSPR